VPDGSGDGQSRGRAAADGVVGDGPEAGVTDLHRPPAGPSVRLTADRMRDLAVPLTRACDELTGITRS